MNSTLDRYRGQDIPLIDGPRGAKVAASTPKGLTATFAVAPRMIEVAPKVWNLVGIGISSRMMVDAPEGLVIFDTGDDLEDGERALVEFRKVSDRQIKAIVYSHNHYAHDTQGFRRVGPRCDDHLPPRRQQKSGRNLDRLRFRRRVPRSRARADFARYERQFGLAPAAARGRTRVFAAVIPPCRSKGTVPATHLGA